MVVFWFNQRWYDYTEPPSNSPGWSWRTCTIQLLPQVLERWQGAIDAGIPLRWSSAAWRRRTLSRLPHPGYAREDAEGSVTAGSAPNRHHEWKEARATGPPGRELAALAGCLESRHSWLQSCLTAFRKLGGRRPSRKLVIWNPAAAKIIGMGATTLPSSAGLRTTACFCRPMP